MTGVSSCDMITVAATDGSNLYAFAASTVSELDGSTLCEFQGLTGHPGTFDVQMSVDGQPRDSQSVTLDKLDECDVSAKLITFDATAT